MTRRPQLQKPSSLSSQISSEQVLAVAGQKVFTHEIDAPGFWRCMLFSLIGTASDGTRLHLSIRLRKGTFTPDFRATYVRIIVHVKERQN